MSETAIERPLARTGHTSPAREPHRDTPAAPAPHEAAAPRKLRRRWIVLGLIAAVVLLSLGGYAWFTAGKQSTDDAQVEADVVPTAARVSGLVKRVPVNDNQHVKKGDVILEIDDADYAAREQQAEAELETAKAQAAAADAQAQIATAGARGGFTSAQAQVSSSGAAVQTARAAVSAATAQLRKAELELNRNRELRAANVVPQSALDDAQASYDTAQANLDQAKAQLAAAQSRIGEAEGRLHQAMPVSSAVAAAEAQARLAHAREKAAEAALDLAKLQLSYTKVVSQVDGTVTKLAVHEGQLISVGQPIAAIVPDETYVVANFKETQIDGMKPGQAVDVEIDAFPGRTFHARVDSLAAGTGARFSLLPPDNASGNFVKVVQRVPVRIAWVDPPKDVVFRPGLSADVTVHLK
jgi:membrane fusion protein (multidrug efflux system)